MSGCCRSDYRPSCSIIALICMTFDKRKLARALLFFNIHNENKFDYSCAKLKGLQICASAYQKDHNFALLPAKEFKILKILSCSILIFDLCVIN